MIKGQSSIEGIFVVGAVFVVFLFLLSYSFEKRSEVKNADSITSEKTNCFKISNLIMGVFINGNGTEIVSKIDYNATLIPSLRIIQINGYKELFCNTPIDLFSSTNLSVGKIRLKNIGDFVNIANA